MDGNWVGRDEEDHVVSCLMLILSDSLQSGLSDRIGLSDANDTGT